MKLCKCDWDAEAIFIEEGGSKYKGLSQVLNFLSRNGWGLKCEYCRGWMADYRKNGRGLLITIGGGKKRGGRRRAPQERTAVIRAVGNAGVGYRYFGESYGLRKNGVDLSQAEGFMGKGDALAGKLGMSVEDLASALKVSTEDLKANTFDISKD